MSYKTETYQVMICDYCNCNIHEDSNHYWISPGEDCSIGGKVAHLFITDTMHFCCKEHLISYIVDHVE